MSSFRFVPKQNSDQLDDIVETSDCLCKEECRKESSDESIPNMPIATEVAKGPEVARCGTKRTSIELDDLESFCPYFRHPQRLVGIRIRREKSCDEFGTKGAKEAELARRRARDKKVSSVLRRIVAKSLGQDFAMKGEGSSESAEAVDGLAPKELEQEK